MSANLKPSSREIQFQIGTTLADIERAAIERTLAAFNGDKPKTAKVLGVSLKTLYNKLNTYMNAGRYTHVDE